MWVPIDVLVCACVSWGASLLASWWAQQRGGGPTTSLYRFLVVVSLVSGFYVLGRALRCLACCGTWW